VRRTFLACSDAVVLALGDPAVRAAWGDPSYLADQTVGMLAGHVARSITTVGGYLDAPPPDDDGVDLASTAAYLAMASALDDAAHAGVRARSAAIAEAGPDAVGGEALDALLALRSRLDDEPPDRRLSVFGGAVMRLDDYLGTRVVEQVVHLDDLARSVGREPWDVDEAAQAHAIRAAVDAGTRVHGSLAMLRALYRGDTDGVIPVI
jgi:hypothetical protein